MTLPEGWESLVLDDVATIKARIGWRGLKASEYAESGPYLIAGKHIRNGHISWSECDHLTQDRYDESHEIQLQNNDVILSKDGTIGIAAFINDLPGPATINGTMMLLRPEQKKLRGDYLFQYLQGERFKKLVQDRISGGSIPHIFQRDMKQLPISLPPIWEQQKIAGILGAVDEAIEATRAVIGQTGRVKSALMTDLLTRGLPGRHKQFKLSPLGEIPADWEVVDMGSLAAPYKGSSTIGPFGSNLVMSDYKDAGVPVIFVRDVKAGRFLYVSKVYVSAEKAKELSAHTARPGDLIATKMGIPPCVACVYPEKAEEAVITADIIRLTPDLKKTSSEWLATFLNSDRGKEEVKKITGGQTRPKITLRDFRSIKTALPSMDEQERILSVLSGTEESIRSSTIRLEQLQLLKSALMQILLTGKVRVPVIESKKYKEAANG